MLTKKKKLSLSKLFLAFCIVSSTHTAQSSANFLTPFTTAVKQFLDPIVDKISTFISPLIESAGDFFKTYKLPIFLAALAGYGAKRVIQHYHSSPSSESEDLTEGHNELPSPDTPLHETQAIPSTRLSDVPGLDTNETLKKAALATSTLPKTSTNQEPSSTKSGSDDDKGKAPTKTIPVIHEHHPKKHKNPDLLPTPTEQYSTMPQASSQSIESGVTVPQNHPTHFSPFNQGKSSVAFGSQPAAGEPSQQTKSSTNASLKSGNKTVLERYRPAGNQKTAPSKKTALSLTHTFNRTVEIAAPPTIKESFLEITHPSTGATTQHLAKQPILPTKKETQTLQENLIEHGGVIKPLKDFARYIVDTVKSWFS